jgi:hypothetical protein
MNEGTNSRRPEQRPELSANVEFLGTRKLRMETTSSRAKKFDPTI